MLYCSDKSGLPSTSTLIGQYPQDIRFGVPIHLAIHHESPLLWDLQSASGVLDDVRGTWKKIKKGKYNMSTLRIYAN